MRRRTRRTASSGPVCLERRRRMTAERCSGVTVSIPDDSTLLTILQIASASASATLQIGKLDDAPSILGVVDYPLAQAARLDGLCVRHVVTSLVGLTQRNLTAQEAGKSGQI